MLYCVCISLNHPSCVAHRGNNRPILNLPDLSSLTLHARLVCIYKEGIHVPCVRHVCSVLLSSYFIVIGSCGRKTILSQLFLLISCPVPKSPLILFKRDLFVSVSTVGDVVGGGTLDDFLDGSPPVCVTLSHGESSLCSLSFLLRKQELFVSLSLP